MESKYRQIKKHPKSQPQNNKHKSVSKSPIRNTNHLKSKISEGSPMPLRQCESHIFQLKPQEGVKTYFGSVVWSMMHEKQYKPYPVLLTQFKHVSLNPLFGLEREAPLYRINVKRCTEGLEQQISRISAEETKLNDRGERIFAPMPRHTMCQICKQQFVQYFQHIESRKHRRQASMALGTQYIRNTINEFQMAIFDQNDAQELQQLNTFCTSLDQAIPLIRSNYKHFLREFNSLSIE